MGSQLQKKLTRVLGASSIAFAVGVVVATTGFVTMASADDSSGGIGIVVTVPPVTGDSLGTSAPSSTSDLPSSVTLTPAGAATSAPASGEYNLGGILYLSGLASHYVWTGNPLDSSAALKITVRNVSKTTFDSSARFWVETATGQAVGQQHELKIPALKPEESRVISTSLDGLGQWTLLHAHVTLTPPTEVEGTKLVAVSRDSYFVVPPLGIAGAAMVGVGAVLAAQLGWLTRLARLARSLLVRS